MPSPEENTAPAWTWSDIAAMQRARPHLVVSDMTAARLHGLPLPGPGPACQDRQPGPGTALIHLTTTAGHRLRRTGVRTHRRSLRPEHVVTLAGVRVTSPIRTLWDLCAPSSGLSHEDLVVLADALMPQEWIPGFGLAEVRTTRRDLDAVRLSMLPFHGSRRARLVSDSMREAVASPMETRTRLGLVAAGLPEPEVGVTLHDDAGHAGPTVDLAYPRWRVVVQYEGAHHRSREQQERDVDRDRWCVRHGWHVVKVTARDVRDGLAAVVPLILAHAAAAEA